MFRPLMAAAFLLFACGAESVDVGSTHSQAPDPADLEPPPPGPPLPEWPDPTACVASTNSDLAGVWVGAFEGDTFKPVKSLRIEIFGASAAQGVCGTAVIGDNAPAPPPPTDPTEAYPPDAGSVGYFEGLYDGAIYTLRDGAMRGDSLHFELDSMELWKDWCALQPSVYVPKLKAWRCVPADDFSASGDTCRIDNLLTGKPETLPLVQCLACQGGFASCVCNESGCTASPGSQRSQRTDFNLQRTGDQLLGPTSDELLDVVLARGN